MPIAHFLLLILAVIGAAGATLWLLMGYGSVQTGLILLLLSLASLAARRFLL